MTEHVPDYCHDSYMTRNLQLAHVNERIPVAVEFLSQFEFDAIAFRGMSGALVAPIIARELGKTLICVRKPDEKCHSSRLVEGDSGARSYVIIDDFIDYGTTVRKIFTAVGEFAPQAKCLGTFQFARCMYDDGTDWFGNQHFHGPHLTMDGLQHFMLYYKNEELLERIMEEAAAEFKAVMKEREELETKLRAERARIVAAGQQLSLDLGRQSLYEIMGITPFPAADRVVTMTTDPSISNISVEVTRNRPGGKMLITELFGRVMGGKTCSST